MSKLKAKFGKIKQKVADQVDELQGDLSRLKVAAAYTYNPNHRHDEDHERESDRIRQEILDSHRYQSFAPQRQGNNVKFYIDGMDYFWALSEILEQATSTIWICDWWLSPELYLRRPPAQYEAYRLDRILKRKAEQGVRIFVQIYKEVNTTMTLNSKYTKHALEELHENISVIRHPDHSGGEIVMYWSHHEKVVLVDNAIACIGGLDICYGRWDTHNAPLADVYADDMTAMVFPGQDYNNSRVADFENVQAWTGNEQARTELGRMPWHDVHTMLTGPAVMDIAQFFVERWNFVRDLKYKHNDRFPLLDWPHDDPLNDQMIRHPHTARFRSGLRFNQQRVHLNDRPTGDMHVQVCRSVGDWSCGWLTEHSIQDAYIQLIREANHFIYIENQFFVSIPGESKTPKVYNQICAALVERILSAARSGEKFKVMIMIPEVPCFPGDLKASQGTLAILDTQYRSLCRGKESLFGLIEAAGYNPRDYVTLFNLRQYDRIKYDKEIWKTAEKESGVLWGEALAAYARINIGDDPPSLEEQNNQTIRFKAMKYDDNINASGDVKKDAKGKEDISTLELPPNVKRAQSIIMLWESCIPAEYQQIASSIARNTLQSGKTVIDEAWFGSEAAEKDAFVTEELYIHSKLMIVDDKKVIIGSANINDRSQMGDRDSEIAIVIEDTDLIETVMDGQKYMAARFAAAFRRQLFKQHLGLIPPQDCPGPITPAMRPVGNVNEYDFGSPEDEVVADPLDDDFHNAWNETARINAEVYQELFHCTPAKGVKTWDDYAKWVPAGKKIGHIHNQENLELGYIKQRLSQIRGHVVEMPTDFLEDAGLIEVSAAVNPVTMPIYL